ncbi:uncharacterized mitochondrial protein-like protein [Tanacetum coccineum]|uniref:Uncharacterized mitochondrial protein-like protein n=1 Tax=Tanacetum coccineum TaxID=301880 RepID=A0ABQ5JBF3_9ASTR
MKARSTLMMGIPNEYQLKFNSIKDAKLLMKAIEKRLQKLVSQLELLGETLEQDVNLKLLRSLSLEWNTHAIVWRNNADLETMSLDDLYNNLKVYEPEVKGMSNSISSSQNMDFVSSSINSPISTNELVNTTQTVKTTHGVPAASTQVNAAHIDNLSDVVICSFFASQPNNPQLISEDLQQIHPDDIEEMNIRWQMAIPRWNVTTAIKEDIFLESAELQEVKTTRTEMVKKETSMMKQLLQHWFGDKPPTPDLSYTGVDVFDDKPIVENKMSDAVKPKSIRKSNDALIIEDWVSDNEEENVSQPKTEKKIVNPSFAKKEFVQSKKTARKTVKYAEQYRQNTHTLRCNQINWNNMMSQKLESNFEMFNKACHVCGSFDHLQNMVPRVVLMKSALVSLNVARQVNTAHRKTTVNGARSMAIHKTGNMSYLIDYEDIDGGYVSFGEITKGGKITDRGSIKTVTKDETSEILKTFITGIENLVDHKVKVIRCDNGTEFENSVMNHFCTKKGILRHYSIARTPQQNDVAERRNRTLIESARTMLADSNCQLLFGTPTLSFMKPFGCPVTILNTKDPLGKFDGKANEGFFVGYSLISKAYRVFNSRTRIVEENLHISFSEHTPNVVGSGPDWLFDIDALTRTMHYEPIVPGTQSNVFAGTKANDNTTSKNSQDDAAKPSNDGVEKVNADSRKGSGYEDQQKDDNVNTNRTNNVNATSSDVNAVSTDELNAAFENLSIEYPNDLNMPPLEDILTSEFLVNEEDDAVEADMNNMYTSVQVGPTLTTRIHKDHPIEYVIRDIQSATQTRHMSKTMKEQGFFVQTLKQRNLHKDLQNCLFACFLSQEELKKVHQALKDSSWIKAMQEELLQFILQEV